MSLADTEKDQLQRRLQEKYSSLKAKCTALKVKIKALESEKNDAKAVSHRLQDTSPD
jgi:uncharacterized protein YlxW (UPF0749 family)